jgi:hypothetical protein
VVASAAILHPQLEESRDLEENPGTGRPQFTAFDRDNRNNGHRLSQLACFRPQCMAHVSSRLDCGPPNTRSHR